MRIVWLLGLTTGCGYISDAKYDLRLDPDQDGVSIEEDCDNEDPNLGVKRTFYADTDGDGFGDPDEIIEACILPEGASENALDCDDTRSDVNPGMEDVFYDGVDADCDGSNDCDQDGDGFDGSAEGGVPTEECPNATDCNDEDPEVRPVAGATEVQFNGEDDDCNVNTGDGDFDGDGFWHANYDAIVQANGLIPMPIPEGKGGDCYDWGAEPVEGFDPSVINGFGDFLQPIEVHPEATERYYDGVDQNCDGLSDFDQDGDGFSTAEYPDREGTIGSDCVDTGSVYGIDAVDINVDATDSWYDGVDQDCAGNNDFDQDADGDMISEYDCDGDGVADVECDLDGDGIADFTAGSDCDDTNASINPSAEEEPADGIDQNCNGFEICFEDIDGDGFGASEVERSDFTCSGTGLSTNDLDCDDDDAAVYPSATELCDGIINDCNTASLPANEQDLDGDTYVECTISGSVWGNVIGGGDCDPADATVFPGAPELIDGIDNDCDTLLSSEEVDGDGDGFVAGDFDAATWMGDPLVIGGQDCDDTVSEQYPGAAYNDSATECLVDLDEDGYAPITEYCFQMDFVDNSGAGWQSASVQVIVDGVLHGLYGTNGGTVTESGCVSGVNIEWQIYFPDTTIAGAELTIYDANGIEIGSGSGSAQGDTWNWGHSSTMLNAPYLSGDVFETVMNPEGLGTDCDDNDFTRYPSAPELCDGVANECGTSLPADEIDNDLDGYVECSIDVNGWWGSSSVVGGGDCNDADSSISPGATEIPNDGIDQDCDGTEPASQNGITSANP